MGRVQALGGAKNHIVVMPDADLTTTIPALLGSAFGNAGERCLAGSVAVAVGDAARNVLAPLCEQTRQLVVGPGDQAGVDVGRSSVPSTGIGLPTISTRGSPRAARSWSTGGPTCTARGSSRSDHPERREPLNDHRSGGTLWACAVGGPCPDAGGGDRAGEPDGARQHGRHFHAGRAGSP